MAGGWRMAGVAAMLSLVGSGVAALVLSDGSVGSAGASGSSLVDRAAPPGRVPQTAPASAGMRLLRQAMAACQDTPYRAVQVTAWLNQGDPTTSVIDVWHQPGQVTIVRAALGTDSTAEPTVASYPDLDGVLGVSPPLLDLLQSNYQVIYTGHGSTAGHAALVVEVRRPGGGLAARFWLDAATKLPLRREIYSGEAGGIRVISEDAFTDLQLGNGSLTGMPRAAVSSSAASSSAAQVGKGSLAALRAQGWPLPLALPGNLALFAATATASGSGGSGQVVGASYSDGLSVISLFVQRGLLAGPMPGWRPVAMAGRTVYAVDPADQGDRSLAWSAGGYVYALVADAPTAMVGQVVAALPAGSAPGFWQRMAHGLHRIASWANPLRQ